MIGMSLARAEYLLLCAEKEHDEFLHRMRHAAANDAIKLTGDKTLKMHAEQVKKAKDLVESLQ